MIKENVLPRLTGECELGPWTGRGEDDVREKLKTLKDFKNDYMEVDKDGIVEDVVPLNKLKAEAVKWIKELSKPKGYIEFGTHSFSWDDSDKTNWYTLAYRDVAKWTIMHLNNITEEDLK